MQIGKLHGYRMAKEWLHHLHVNDKLLSATNPQI